ncbi:MAG TPA: hypothetical protein PKZ37_16825 [Gallionellaceae bacterium]|jgi:hypothetical protein|nr:hypothetical protein [Gallionellaceae bacterium]
MNIVAYRLLIASAITTVYFAHILKPTSVGAYIFITVWLLLPHLVMAALLVFAKRNPSALSHLNLVIPLVAIGGILFLVFVMFLNSDAQGGIAVLLTPIYQGIALVFLIPIVQWLSHNETT